MSFAARTSLRKSLRAAWDEPARGHRTVCLSIPAPAPALLAIIADSPGRRRDARQGYGIGRMRLFCLQGSGDSGGESNMGTLRSSFASGGKERRALCIAQVDESTASTYDRTVALIVTHGNRTAPSFNGRTPASGAGYRGSNPWGAARASRFAPNIPTFARQSSADRNRT